MNRMEIVTDKVVTGGIVYVNRHDLHPSPAGLYILAKALPDQASWWAWHLWSGEFEPLLSNPVPAGSMSWQVQLTRSVEEFGTGYQWIVSRRGVEKIFKAQTEAIRLLGL